MEPTPYPIQFSVDYPDRQLNRLTTLLRLVLVIPILIIMNAVWGETWEWTSNATTASGSGAGGVLVLEERGSTQRR